MWVPLTLPASTGCTSTSPSEAAFKPGRCSMTTLLLPDHSVQGHNFPRGVLERHSGSPVEVNPESDLRGEVERADDGVCDRSGLAAERVQRQARRPVR